VLSVRLTIFEKQLRELRGSHLLFISHHTYSPVSRYLEIDYPSVIQHTGSIGDGGVQCVAQAIKHNTTLQKINLLDNNNESQIAEGLKEHNSRKEKVYCASKRLGLASF
jgi:hypothetical protein